MAEWTEYVRQRLRLPALGEAREAEIVEDLARQLEDAYRDARLAGASDREAHDRAEQHVADWDALGRELTRSRRARVGALVRWAGQREDREIVARGRLGFLAQLRQDVIYGARALRHQAGLTAVAVVSLALGIGANTAIFSVVDALLFRTLPVRNPEELVVLTNPEWKGVAYGLQSGGLQAGVLAYPEFQGLRDRSAALDGLFAFSSQLYSVPVGLDESDERAADILMVSGTYFPTLGIEPSAGHVFGTSIDLPGASPAEAVVSYQFWNDRLQHDPGVIGRTIRVRRTLFTIVGVLPASFTGIVIGDAPDIWVPIAMLPAVVPGADWLTQPPGTRSRAMFLHVVGRLRSGVSLAQANVAAKLAFKQVLETEAPQIADPDRRQQFLSSTVVARSASRGVSQLRAQYGQPLSVLLGIVALLLLLACGNVANLLLSRATGREHEFAVRVALGAKRGRLIRQLLTESVLLAGLGALAGLSVARLGTRTLLRLVSGTSVPVPLDAGLDQRVLAFTAIIAVATGILAGLAPALQSTRPDVNVALRSSASNITGRRRGIGRWPLPRLLVGAQVALSLLLLITAGLFVRSLEKLAEVPLGYDSGDLVIFNLNATNSGYRLAEIPPLFQDLLSRLATTRGVRAVSLSTTGLFSLGGDGGDEVSFPDVVMPPGKNMSARFDDVGPSYFATLGVPVLRGRDVEPQDGTGPRSAWLNHTMAEYYFPGQDPVGRRMVVHYSFGLAEYEIRGVVADSRSVSIRAEMERRFYVPFFGAANEPWFAVFEIRTAAADSASVLPAVRQLVRDARLDPAEFHTVGDLLGRWLVRDRLTARLASLFSALALVLACAGLYGVLSYSVSRRVKEIGVRLTFGADRNNILRLILKEALTVTVAGVAVGLAAAWFAARSLSILLFGLTTHDPIALVGATSLLVLVAALAAAVPAWRASRTDPLTALRTN